MIPASFAFQRFRAILGRPLFTIAIFLSSFLLFLIQPMFARLLLPKLGGAPSVWNVAMLFYQALLLAGYLYAHWLARFEIRRQVLIHISALAIAALTLPLSLADPACLGAESPVTSIIGLLAISIGPVFFIVSAQAPLLQAWFARSGHAAAHNPYFLYSASNAGSFLALLSYPLLVEPQFPLFSQTASWSFGFLILLVAVAACGIVAAAAGRNHPQCLQGAQEPLTSRKPTWNARLLWIALAAVPSGLLLSTTSHLTTDIMAMPLLWVIPLAIYLLTFVIVFDDRSGRIVAHSRRIAPYCLVALAWSVFLPLKSMPWLSAGLSLLSLFYVTLALHGRLAAGRPSADRLTEFYLWLSVGGALGGVFCALLAPQIFNWTYEHPLLLLAAAALLRGEQVVLWASRLSAARVAVPVTLFAVLALVTAIGINEGAGWAVSRALTAVAAMLLIENSAAFTVCLGLLMLAGGGWGKLAAERADYSSRSFFGTYFVRDDGLLGQRFFVHGTTVHGVQRLQPAAVLQPTSYYGPGSGIAQVLDDARGSFPVARTVGIVGLGIGTLACYKRPGETWTAFEIDSKVVEIARDPEKFTFMSDCGSDIQVVVGDGRLELAKIPASAFDVLAVDAFSSDSIPLHMLTAEAFAVYQRALRPDGILLVHITNRHLDLELVIESIAEANGWSALIRRENGREDAASLAPSRWVALTRSRSRLEEIAKASGVDWDTLRSTTGLRPWTDDWASVLPVLIF
jgi:SAM-dependent methyltransferase